MKPKGLTTAFAWRKTCGWKSDKMAIVQAAANKEVHRFLNPSHDVRMRKAK